MPHARKASNSSCTDCASGVFSIGDEGRSVLLHQTVKRGPLGAVNFDS
jgi:hypothetical protein